MSEFELVVRGGSIVTARGVTIADVGIAAGTIKAVGPNLSGQADEVVEAGGLHVFPGGVDSHVHFNEPGRSDWETIADGSRALAAGGYTSFVDMPLNNLPVTIDGAAFDLKLGAARHSSIVDFGLWGGLVPENLDHLAELHERGVVGFKAFMCPSGIDEFPACDENALRAGMKRIADLDSVLLVHAEAPAALYPPSAGRSPSDFVSSRPPEAEWMAIAQAIASARENSCRLHVVHISTARGFELIREAQEQGVDVTGETCPQYLLYVSSDLERLGGIGKCAPPFRSPTLQHELCRALVEGRIPMVVSDHSPSTLDLKQGDDFFAIWGGISGCQSTRQLLLADERLELPLIAAITATNVARRFRLAHKGDIAPGFDADLWLVDLSHEGVVRREDLLYRNAFSAHEGQPIRGRTIRTLVRGQTVFVDGTFPSAGTGRLVRPAPAGG